MPPTQAVPVKNWWSLGRIGGVPVRLHWSALIGALFFSGFRLAPGAWLGFVVVILVHELGHAAVVRFAGQRATGIDVHGFGGECHWSGQATPLQRAAIAWGGVWAQLALLVIAIPVSIVAGHALGSFGSDLFYALTFANLMLAAINLLPIGRLDGREAWKLPLLVVHWFQQRERRRARSSAKAPYTARRASPEPASPPASAPAAKPTGAPRAGQNDLAQLFAQIASDAKDARKPRRPS